MKKVISVVMSEKNSNDKHALPFLTDFVARTQRKPTLILMYASLAMIAWKYFVIPHELITRQSSESAFLLGTYKIFGGFFLFGIIPILIIKIVFREKISAYGLQLGNGRRILINSLIFVPLMLMIGMLTARDSTFWNVYPYNPVVADVPSLFFCHALTYLAYYFGWEFFFRGFIQHGLHDSMGICNALLVQTMASAILHFGHPMSETLGSIVGGLLWGFLVLRCRSLWAVFIQHSVLGITLDWFILKNSIAIAQ